MIAAKGRLGRTDGNSPDIIIPRVNLQLKETEYDGQTYVCPTWEQMGEFTFELAKKILDSGQTFNRAIALAKGGWTWARTLVDYLDIDKISSMRIKSYKGVKNKAVKPQIIQPLQDAIVGEKVLIFDEVIDSGDTIAEAIQDVELHGASDIKIATLCLKPRSNVKTDLFAFETNAWVCFPHENRETIEERMRAWGESGKSVDEIKQRLITIGLPPNQVEYFCRLNVK